MLKRIVPQVLLLAMVAIIPGQSQGTNTDPKASDQNGNGPPAWVMSKGQSDGAPTKEEKKAAAVERPVSGVITSADGKPVSGAVVQLKNTRTLQIRSFITRDKGDYYFAGLSKDVDYELKAQAKGHTSATHTLSSFDTRAQPVLNLQLK